MRSLLVPAACLAFLAPAAPAASTAIIETVAGGGTPDHVAATAANLNGPSAAALAPGGDLFLAVSGHNRVFRIDAAGILHAVVGTGELGSTGDGGPASAARLWYPEGVAFDAGGNLHISEGNRVRRVDAATGIITTVAGGDIWQDSGDGGPAAAARFKRPDDLVFDAAGSLYVLDREALKVRRIDAATGIISTYAGGGFIWADGWPATQTYLLYPTDLAFDPAGNLLIAESCRVRKVDRITRIVSTVAGTGTCGFSGDGGAATAALLDHPQGVDVDTAGALLIADLYNKRVRRVDPATRVITTAAGSGAPDWSGDGGPATSAGLQPWGVQAGAGGDFLVLDPVNQRVRRVDGATGTISTVAGNGDCCFFGEGIPAREAQMSDPLDVALDAGGNLFVLDQRNARVRRVDRATGIITTVAGNGTSGFSGDGGPAVDAALDVESGGAVAADASGNLFIADVGNRRVRRVDAATGVIRTVAGNGTSPYNGEDLPAIDAGMAPLSIAVDGGGNLLVLDSYNVRVRRVDAATGLIRTVAGNGGFAYSGDGAPATASSLYYPWDVAVDAGGHLFIAEGGFHDERYPTGSNRIRKVDAVTGILSTVAGTGAFYSGPDGVIATSSGLFLPLAVAVDGAGNLAFSEGVDNETGSVRGGVRGVDAVTRIVDRVTGPVDVTTSCWSLGDGGPAVDAGVCFARGLAFDAAGNLFIADAGTDRIRRVRLGDAVPVADAGDDLEAACGSLAGAAVTLDGSGSTDLDSTFGTHDDIVSFEWFEQTTTGDRIPLGSGETLTRTLPYGAHDVALVVTDGRGNAATDHVTVTVREAPPGDLFVAFAPARLWPPNHRMVDVIAEPSAGNACAGQPLFTLVSITSSEPDDAPGGTDGTTRDDIQEASPGTSDFAFRLRAERDALGPGRDYTVTYLASNATGGSTVSAVLGVPHDMAGVVDPVVLSVTETASGTSVRWSEVAGARSYDLLRGDLDELKVVGGGVSLHSAVCLAPGWPTAGEPGPLDTAVPAPGAIFYYLVAYDDGAPSGYGSAEAALPLLPPPGVCF